ncbi:MAG: hypothetical protein KDK70_07655 [Myxococcales bacterium]|nr:hypothetical protein [Myxococcales bacterium]
MSSMHGGRCGALLALGLLGPIACFTPGQAPPLDAETDTETEAAEGAETEDPTDDGESTGEPSPSQDPCPQYCEVIGDHCEGELAQYPGQAICEATCALMDPGEPGDVLGNSATCRAHHALLAAESPTPHCLHAGPTGDTTCGGPCESFCSLAQQACAGGLSPFADADDCIAECEGWDPEPKYFATIEDGDTYACRMHHLTLAAVQPEGHCGHIGTDSPVCRDP